MSIIICDCNVQVVEKSKWKNGFALQICPAISSVTLEVYLVSLCCKLCCIVLLCVGDHDHAAGAWSKFFFFVILSSLFVFFSLALCWTVRCFATFVLNLIIRKLFLFRTFCISLIQINGRDRNVFFSVFFFKCAAEIEWKRLKMLHFKRKLEQFH